MGSRLVSTLPAALVTILVLGTAETQADVWTFRDAKGVSHFSSTPKPGWKILPGVKVVRQEVAAPQPELEQEAPHPALVGALWTFRDADGISHFSLTPKPGWRCLDAGSRAMAKASDGTFDALIRKYAAAEGVDPMLVKALIRAESGFDPDAKSGSGAHGLMQLTLPTARAHGAADVYDPRQNIRAGVRHLRALLDRFANDSKLALAAYNAGEYAVERYRGLPPFPETVAYVQRVLRYRQEYSLEEGRRAT